MFLDYLNFIFNMGSRVPSITAKRKKTSWVYLCQCGFCTSVTFFKGVCFCLFMCYLCFTKSPYHMIISTHVMTKKWTHKIDKK